MDNKQVDVAVIGANSLIGQAVFEVLDDRDFPVKDIYPLDDADSIGESVEFGKHQLTIHDLSDFDFSQVQLVFCCLSDIRSAEVIPHVMENGIRVIDFSSYSLHQPDVRTVIPEINPEQLDADPTDLLFASPDSAMVQMLLALNPIHRTAGIKRIHSITLEAVSGTGRAGIDELSSQSIALFNLKEINSKHFSRQIAFNVLSSELEDLDKLCDLDSRRREITQLILSDPDITLQDIRINVPVFFGHTQILSIETRQQLGPEQAIQLIREAPGLKYAGEKDFPTAVTQGNQAKDVLIGPVWGDESMKNGLNLWVVADNIRRGKAINGVQIAEILVKGYL
jgi:aspartate-semialdehyde dehydrogenase